ncbi:hypothetical protein Tco_0084149 [Tanacetum coccineum]
MLRAFSLFLLALAASEVFGADEDAGSVVAWSPLVIISHSIWSVMAIYCRIFMDHRSYSPFLIIGILSAVTDEVRWNSKRSPEFTWEREDYMKSKYPQLFVDRADESAIACRDLEAAFEYPDERYDGVEASHIESAELGIPAVECNKDDADDVIVTVGTSQGVEDRNLTSGSSSSSSASSSADVTLAVSDHSLPPIHDIQNGSPQVQQLPNSGIQDQEVQVQSNLMSAIVSISEVLAQTTSELIVAAETLIINPTITENQTAILSMSEVLSQNTLEPIVAVETPIATHPQIQNAAPLEPDDVATLLINLISIFLRHLPQSGHS